MVELWGRLSPRLREPRPACRDALSEVPSGVRSGDRMKVALLIVGTLLPIFLVPFLIFGL